VLFARLTCEREVWLARVPNASRHVEGKLTDPVRAVELFHGADPFVPMPLEPCVRIDTTHPTPADAAAQIVALYELSLVTTCREQPADRPERGQQPG
jgi:hypothetical protein